MNRRWINFGKYSSPPIGRGKILDCDFFGAEGSVFKLYLKVEVNGILYEGTLPVKLSEDEEE
jgi:hypothetical protein